MPFPPDMAKGTCCLLNACRAQGLKLATAEFCTGGLLAALLTEIPGASDEFDRGFVSYSNASKISMLSVPQAVIAGHGAVIPRADPCRDGKNFPHWRAAPARMAGRRRRGCQGE